MKNSNLKNFTVIDHKHLVKSPNSQRYMMKVKCNNCKNIAFKFDLNSACRPCKLKSRATHNMSNTSFYRRYRAMKNRVLNKNLLCYPYYGGKGITYEKKWETFEGFKKDMYTSFLKALASTKTPYLDRIDNSKNYCKSNCRWVTFAKSNENKTSTIYVRYNNKNLTLKQAASIAGVAIPTLRYRVKSGWDVSKIINKKSINRIKNKQ